MFTTIAILGAATPTGQALATSLVSGSLGLRLCDQNEAATQQLVEKLKRLVPQADVEALSCAATASWEADFAILAMPLAAQADAARQIAPYVTQKTVWSVADPVHEAGKDLESAPVVLAALHRLLPHSHIRPLPLPYSPDPKDREQVLALDAAWWREQLGHEDAPLGPEKTS